MRQIYHEANTCSAECIELHDHFLTHRGLPSCVSWPLLVHQHEQDPLASPNIQNPVTVSLPGWIRLVTKASQASTTEFCCGAARVATSSGGVSRGLKSVRNNVAFLDLKFTLYSRNYEAKVDIQS